MRRANTIAFSCGRKGAGKSAWLQRNFVSKARRIIHVDPNGELRDDPNVLMCASYDQLLVSLRAFAASNQTDWRVAVALDDVGDAAALFDLLAPQRSFGEGSLARAFNGLAVECGECDAIAPLHGTPSAVQSAWRRGRHHQLDLYMATQRAAACDVLLRSLADVVAVFALDEPADLAWVEGKMGRAAADAVAQLPDHWHVEKRQGNSCVQLCDERDRVRRQIPIARRGAPIVEPANGSKGPV